MIRIVVATLVASTPKFLSTHPAPKERIQDIEKNLPRVLPLYQQAKH